MQDICSIAGKFTAVIAVLMVVLCLSGEICEHLSHPKKAFEGFYNRYIKRGFDIVITGTALLVIWPIYLIIGILILAEDGFPVFYRAYRGGYRNKPFRICKFRSMVKNADKIGGGTTAFHDPRITKFGNFLRKVKLDEIPQIGQVFLGKMSLIGPRPELLCYVNQYEGEEKDILQVRPGITDFSSVEFVSLDEIVGGENADEMYEKYVLKKKNEMRVKYANQVSFRTDVYILFKTLKAVFGKAFGLVSRKAVNKDNINNNETPMRETSNSVR